MGNAFVVVFDVLVVVVTPTNNSRMKLFLMVSRRLALTENTHTHNNKINNRVDTVRRDAIARVSSAAKDLPSG
jgi:hypothetical protein